MGAAPHCCVSSVFVRIGFLGLWLVVAISYDGAQTPPSVSEKLLEHLLAYSHNGLLGVSPREPSEWLVSRFRSVLDVLEAKCPETRQKLSVLGGAGYQTLRSARSPRPTTRHLYWLALLLRKNDAEDGDSGPCDSNLAGLLLVYEQSPRVNKETPQLEPGRQTKQTDCPG